MTKARILLIALLVIIALAAIRRGVRDMRAIVSEVVYDPYQSSGTSSRAVGIWRARGYS
jgi:hypothetical protein